ncbi:MAG: type II toxin-antitoxin system HicB family antitoxin [Burkholderiaceae bacterium]|jgi:predicted HicB family RNase H-like nuclease|nr:type II toxin-antitoxin system HicB family antitoxin [Betaproteobacteria bacterium]
MSMMNYKGFSARIEYSDEDGCFIGRVAGIQDVIGFHGQSVAKLRAAFKEAIDDYLETCARVGKQPNKPYSGQFRLRLSPDLHARVAIAAESKGKSLNTLITDLIERAV